LSTLTATSENTVGNCLGEVAQRLLVDSPMGN